MPRDRILHSLLAGVLVLVLLQSCGIPGSAPPREKPAPPAKVENGGVKETELATIKLTPKAEERLGIQLATAEYGSAARSETLAGEVIIPAGQSRIVAAPVTGTLEPAGKSALTPGMHLRDGQPVFRLLPLVSAQRDLRVTAEAELTSARTRSETAKARVTRAEQMLRDRVGSARSLEDARQELDLSVTAVKTAEARLEQLQRAPLDADVTLTIRSPLSGILSQVHVSPEQQVAAGSALFEVVRADPVWIRVPIYAGRQDSFNPGASARITPIGDDRRAGWMARPVEAPPSADPLAVTVDLYFELSNRDLSLRPQQKVNATLPLRGEHRALKVPKASILYDMHGGTWLYENTASHTFVRRRVDVAEMQGSAAVIRAGLAAGARVVTTGAAELFGTEFGVGK